MRNMVVGDFQGLQKTIVKADGEDDEGCGADAIPSPDVPRITLERKIQATSDSQLKQMYTIQLEELLREQEEIERTFHQIAGRVSARPQELFSSKSDLIGIHDCYYTLVEAFHNTCYNLGKHDWAMTKLYVFASMCESKIAPQEVVKAMHDTCYLEPSITIV